MIVYGILGLGFVFHGEMVLHCGAASALWALAIRHEWGYIAVYAAIVGCAVWWAWVQIHNSHVIQPCVDFGFSEMRCKQLLGKSGDVDMAPVMANFAAYAILCFTASSMIYVGYDSWKKRKLTMPHARDLRKIQITVLLALFLPLLLDSTVVKQMEWRAKNYHEWISCQLEG
eukprot:gene29296-17453_t